MAILSDISRRINPCRPILGQPEPPAPVASPLSEAGSKGVPPTVGGRPGKLRGVEPPIPGDTIN
jgi:hypothetical protein